MILEKRVDADLRDEKWWHVIVMEQIQKGK